MNADESLGPVILLIEDNEDDVFLMRRALRNAKLSVSLHVVTDGQQGLDYLDGVEKFSDRVLFPMPGLVLLDLKLPYVHGFEVLAWIRQKASLKNLAVAVLTSSPEERDLQKALDLGATTYLVKPPTPEMILHVLSAANAPATAPLATAIPNTQADAA